MIVIQNCESFAECSLCGKDIKEDKNIKSISIGRTESFMISKNLCEQCRKELIFELTKVTYNFINPEYFENFAKMFLRKDRKIIMFKQHNEKHLMIVLTKFSRPSWDEFVTWTYNLSIGDFYHGHYFDDYKKALKDFEER